MPSADAELGQCWRRIPKKPGQRQLPRRLDFCGGSNGRPGARRVARNYDIGRTCDEIRRQFRHTIKLVLAGHDREIQIEVLAVNPIPALRLGMCAAATAFGMVSERQPGTFAEQMH